MPLRLPSPIFSDCNLLFFLSINQGNVDSSYTVGPTYAWFLSERVLSTNGSPVEKSRGKSSLRARTLDVGLTLGSGLAMI